MKFQQHIAKTLEQMNSEFSKLKQKSKNFEFGTVQRCLNFADLSKNAEKCILPTWCLLAKISFDIAENGPFFIFLIRTRIRFQFAYNYSARIELR